MKLNAAGLAGAKAFIADRRSAPEWRSLRIIDMLNALVEEGLQVRVQYVTGNWADVNTLVDLHSAEQLEL
jgi:dTDP-glucose pyrophosphorylase